MNRGWPCLETRGISVNYVIKVVSGIVTKFTVDNNYCMTPHKQELIKDGLVLRPALFRDWDKILLKEIEAQASIRGNTVSSFP